MNTITVVGSFSMDLTVTVAQFPAAGETVIGKSMAKNPGGKGANQCIACARLGQKPTMIGMVGNDEDAQTILDCFVREGVNIDHVLRSADQPTAMALIEVDQNGQNRIVVIPGANYEYRTSDLLAVRAVLEQSELVVAQLEMHPSIIETLSQICAARGVPLLLNPAPAVPLSPELLSRVDYLTPNETELAILTGMPVQNEEQVQAAAARLLQWGVKNVIATLGPKGALLANRQGMEWVAGYPVQAVDTVAAGDAFNGALACALVAKQSLRQAVELANAVGALTVTRPGAIPALPTAQEVREFLAARQ